MIEPAAYIALASNPIASEIFVVAMGSVEECHEALADDPEIVGAECKKVILFDDDMGININKWLIYLKIPRQERISIIQEIGKQLLVAFAD